MSRCWRRLPTRIANSFRFLINSPDRSEDENYGGRSRREKFARLRPPALFGDRSASPFTVSYTAFRGMGGRLGCELGACSALSIDHADLGGAAHHAKGLCHPQRER